MWCFLFLFMFLGFVCLFVSLGLSGSRLAARRVCASSTLEDISIFPKWLHQLTGVPPEGREYSQ